MLSLVIFVTITDFLTIKIIDQKTEINSFLMVFEKSVEYFEPKIFKTLLKIINHFSNDM